MNPSQLTYAFDTLILTVTITPFNASVPVSALNARFNSILNQLNSIITNSGISLMASSNPMLPVPLTISNHTAVSFYTYQSQSQPPMTTLCNSFNLTVTSKQLSCPAATSSLLSFSPFWSRCNLTTNQQTLDTTCIDFNGQPGGQGTWCGPGYANYPSTTTVACKSVESFPPSIDLDPSATLSYTTPVMAGSAIPIAWLWPLNASQSSTMDVLFYANSTAYSDLLATVLSNSNQTIVTIPIDAPASTTAFITLRCTQFVQSKPSINITFTQINPLSLCPLNSCIDQPNTHCVESTGQCECNNGFVRDSISTIVAPGCVLPCQGLCRSSEDCSSTLSTECAHCNDGFSGLLCNVPNTCNPHLAEVHTSPIGISDGSCNYHGYKAKSSNGFCDSTCDCDNSFVGTDCSVCALTTGTTLPITARCSSPGTDIKQTQIACAQCECYPGYIGSRCEIGAIRGNVTFILDPSSTIPPPTNTTATTFPGSQFLSPAGQFVATRDMASSLGVDQSFVTITNIERHDVPTSGFHMLQAGTKITTVTYTISPTAADNGNGLSNLGQLTDTWDSMKGQFSNLPMSDTDSRRELGTPQGASNSTMPSQCTDPLTCCNDMPCPKPKKTNTGLIIIAIVVPIVIVILIFILVICLVRYAKNHQKWCFAPKKSHTSNHSNRDVELGSNSNSPGSSAQNTTNNGSNNNSIRSTAVDLEPIDDGEQLPSGWSKHKHTVTGQILYVNQELMVSQKNSPNQGIGGESAASAW